MIVQSFPLLKLPLLPLMEILSYLSPDAKIGFSMVSKKTKQLLNGNQKFNLEIIESSRSYKIVCKNHQSGSELLTVETYGLRDYCPEKDFFCRKIDGTDVCMMEEKNILTTYWKDSFDGYQKMISILCNAFKIQSFSISFSFRNKTNYLKIVEHIQEMRSELMINISKIEMSYDSDENIHRTFLANFMDVPELILESDYLKYRHNDADANSGLCYITYASWFTYEDLNLLMKCKKVTLWNLKWTTQEMNQFVKKWLQISTMEKVDFVANVADHQLALKGLPVTRHLKALSFDRNVPQQLTECFEIQRNDGVKANIWNQEGYFVMRTYK